MGFARPSKRLLTRHFAACGFFGRKRMALIHTSDLGLTSNPAQSAAPVLRSLVIGLVLTSLTATMPVMAAESVKLSYGTCFKKGRR
jgi:hypothetical protein